MAAELLGVPEEFLEALRFMRKIPDQVIPEFPGV
jgi:hypothetical protein